MPTPTKGKARLEKASADRVARVLKEAHEAYTDDPHQDVDALLAKTAREHNMPVAHAGILANGWNTVTQNSRRLLSDSATEKYGSFPLATAERIQEILTPSAVARKEAQALATVSAASWDPLVRSGGPVIRPEISVTGRSAMTKAAELSPAQKQASWEADLRQLKATVKQAEAAQLPVVRARETWLALTDKIASFFQNHSPLAGARAPWQDFEYAVRSRHGSYFDGLLDKVYQTLPFKEARDRSRPGQRMLAYQPSAAPFSYFEAYRQHGDHWNTVKQAQEDAVAAVWAAAEDFAAKHAIDIDLVDVDEEDDHCDEKIAATRDLLAMMEPAPSLPTRTPLQRVMAKEGSLARVIRGALGRFVFDLDSYLSPPETKEATETPAGRSIFDSVAQVAPAGGGQVTVDLWGSKEASLLGMVGAGGIGGAAANVSRAIFPPAKTPGEMIDSTIDDLTPAAVQSEKRNIRAQTILSDLLSNDDVIAGHDPDQVIRTYNEIAAVAPRVAIQSALVRPWLHRLLVGRPDPFELQGLTDLETALQKNELAGKTFASRQTAPPPAPANLAY